MPLMRALEQPNITAAHDNNKMPGMLLFNTATADTRGRDASLEIALGSPTNGALASTL
jgi:hypothetical protein